MKIVSTAAACAAALTLTATAAVAATPQVTRAEYKKVQLGMGVNRVTHIVGSKGKVYSGSADDACLIKQYSGWNGLKIYFKWDDNASGKLVLTEKDKIKPGGGVIMGFCPGPS